MRLTEIICAFILLVYGVTGCLAEGSNAFEFINFGIGARPLALGGAFSAASDDTALIHYNPAGIATINEFKTAVSYTEYVEGLHHSNISAVLPVELILKSTLGFSITNLSIRNIAEYDYTGRRLNTVSAYSYMASLSYAAELTRWLMLGASAKFVHEKLYTKDESSYMFDAGFWHPSVIPWLSVGGSIMNIGPGIKYERESFNIPKTYRLGASYNLPLYNRSVILTADTSKVVNETRVLSTGIEINSLAPISIRTGYSSQKKEGSKFACGLGFGSDKIKLDYAFLPYGKLGDSHSITIEYMFEPAKKSAKTQLKEEEAEILYNKAMQASIAGDDILALKLLHQAKKTYASNPKIAALQSELSNSLFDKANSLYVNENKVDSAIEILNAIISYGSHKGAKQLMETLEKEKKP